MDIAIKLKSLREKHGWSQNKLAQEVGISQSFINQIESGAKQPSYEVLSGICSALGITLSDFFSDEAPDIPPELRRLLDAAKDLTPEQQKMLASFIKTIR